MMNKKGEKEDLPGKAVMIIILVIAFLIALYILFLPPEERNQLLNGPSTTQPSTPTTSVTELFSESPGKLYPLREYLTTKNIPSIELYTKTILENTNLASSLSISKSLFSENSQSLYFTQEYPDQESSIYFSTTGDNSGTLNLYTNNNLFFSENIIKNEVKIINIPQNLLKNKNTLRFSVTSPGIAFWRTNIINLKDIGVRQEVESVNTKEQRLFTFTNEEIASLNSAKLSYYQFCNSDKDTTLRILLNEIELFNGDLKCIGTSTELDLTKSALRNENTLTFEIDKGDYSFNQIKIQTDTKEQTYPYYTFELQKSEYDQIINATLKLAFNDDERYKNSFLQLNNKQFPIKTREAFYETPVQDYLEVGTNYIRIEPLTSFELISIKIIAEENNG